MAAYRKVGDKWRAEIVRRGVRKSAYRKSKPAAEAWAREMETKILGLKLTDKTFYNALSRYEETVAPQHKGARWDRARINAWRGQLADRPILEMTSDVIAKWRDDRLKKVSTGTVRREMNLYGAIFETATVEWDWLAANPFRKVRRPPDGKPRDRIILDEEVRAFVAACHSPTEKRVAKALLFALATGMRAGEICGIRREHISELLCVLPDTKNGQSRKVPLSKKARALLPKDGFSLTSAQLDVHFRIVRDKLNTDYTFHATRHTAATRIGHSGKLSVYEMCAMFGWKDPKMALRYINSDISDIADRL